MQLRGYAARVDASDRRSGMWRDRVSASHPTRPWGRYHRAAVALDLSSQRRTRERGTQRRWTPARSSTRGTGRTDSVRPGNSPDHPAEQSSNTRACLAGLRDRDCRPGFDPRRDERGKLSGADITDEHAHRKQMARGISVTCSRPPAAEARRNWPCETRARSFHGSSTGWRAGLLHARPQRFRYGRR